MTDLEKQLIKHAIKSIRENMKASKDFKEALWIREPTETIFDEKMHEQWNSVMDILIPDNLVNKYEENEGESISDEISNALCNYVYDDSCEEIFFNYLEKIWEGKPA